LVGIGSVDRLQGAPESMRPTRYLRDATSLISIALHVNEAACDLIAESIRDKELPASYHSYQMFTLTIINCAHACPTGAIPATLGRRIRIEIGGTPTEYAAIVGWRCRWGCSGMLKCTGGYKDIPLPDTEPTARNCSATKARWTRGRRDCVDSAA